MKRFITFLLVLCLPLLAVANGGYIPGTVSIVTSSANGITTYTFTGNYNVRYNPAVNKGFVILSGSEGNTIAVTGQDSSTGNNFFCYVPPGDALYQQAKNALYMAANGMQLGATYTNTSNLKCTSISLGVDSRRLD